ncbi:hypothetical protein LXL04_038031 [Taraxacum kok-saghyz]
MSSSCATLPHRLRTEWPTANKFSSIVKAQPYRNRCGLSRRDFATKGIVAAGALVMPSTLLSQSAQCLERLPFKKDGYNFWTWRGHKIHYVEEGEGFLIVLIHGFGASAFHWRYNTPELAKKYKVYAVDLLGFGWSEKALVDYDALVWRDQVADFLKEIVKEPTILVGNRRTKKCKKWKDAFID